MHRPKPYLFCEDISTLFHFHLAAADEGSTTSGQRQENKDLLSSFQSTDLDDNSPSSDQEHPDLTVSPSTKHMSELTMCITKSNCVQPLNEILEYCTYLLFIKWCINTCFQVTHVSYYSSKYKTNKCKASPPV